MLRALRAVRSIVLPALILPLPLSLLLAAAAPADVRAGARIELGDGRDLEVSFMAQLWDVTTFDAAGAGGAPAADRSDLFVRRGRFGVKGQAYPRVSYRVWFAYDNLGKDPLSAAPGGVQADNKDLYVWDAYFTIALDDTWAHLTAGYFRPQIGRESITSAFAVNSLVKALANGYLREHVVGRSNGRETGLNLGGLLRGDGRGLRWDVGIFDTNHAGIAGSGGAEWAPLWTGRLALTLGEPETDRYGLGYAVNDFGERPGLTVAVNGSWQGQTVETVLESFDLVNGLVRTYLGGFRRNASWGADLRLNRGPLSLTAEYDVLHRRFGAPLVATADDLHGDEYTDRVGHVRAGWNLFLRNGQVLEPTLMYSRFAADRLSALHPGGEHELLALGVNWYLDRNRWKVALHWVRQDGEPVSGYGGSSGDRRGNFLGLGLQFMF
jgi:hypothetical protein